MTNKARDKAIKSLEYVNGTTLRKKASTYADILRAIDIALQEQAKEIKKELEEMSFGDGLIKISEEFNDWKEFWEKYGVKEEGKDEKK